MIDQPWRSDVELILDGFCDDGLLMAIEKINRSRCSIFVWSLNGRRFITSRKYARAAMLLEDARREMMRRRP